MKEQRFFTVEDSHVGKRLDRYLAEQMPDYSRSRIQALIAGGQVLLANSVVADGAKKIQTGQSIAITLPEPVALEVKAVAMPLAIVFEDAHIIVIDKPAGLTVHPAPGHSDDTLVNALLAHCGDSLSGIGGVMRPGIVHRLDKETSGLMVVAKHDEAHQALSKQLQDRTMKREYLAAIWGVWHPPGGVIEGNIGRSTTNRKKMAVVKFGGKPARTHYETRERFLVSGKPVASLVACTLDSGRTHQIRVHMAHGGHAVIGDPLYGNRPKQKELPDSVRLFPRQALHARRLTLVHPENGKTIEFTSEIPKDMAELISTLRGLK